MALYQSGTGLAALVGVGTTNPTSNLQVYGTPIAAGNVFSVLNTAASGNVAQFSSSTGTALIINSIGNVGIGTTNPTSNLQVVGNVLSGNVISSVAMYGVLAGSNTIGASTVTATTVSATSLIGTHYGVIAGANTIACSSVTAQGTAAEGAVYLTGRAIEIGTGQTSDTTAYIDLHTAEGTYSDFTFRIIRNAGANGTAYWTNRGSGGSYFQNQDSGDFYFQTGGVSIGSITASGVIYFGKSNYTAQTGSRPGVNYVLSYDCATPSAPTAGATYYGHNVSFSGGNLNGKMWNNSGAPSFYAADTFLQATGCYDGTNNGTGAANQYAGNLYLDGGLSWCLGGSGTTNQCYAGSIFFRTGLNGGGLTAGTPTTRMIIQSNTGYVGIATNSPSDVLDVNGTIRCRAEIYNKDGTNGFVQMTRGSTTIPGYLAFYKADSTRVGYIGWQYDSNNLLLNTENGFTGYVVQSKLGVAMAPTFTLDVSGGIRCAVNGSTSSAEGTNNCIAAYAPGGTTILASIWMGYDPTNDCGYINSARSGQIRPVCLQTRGGGVGIGLTNPSYTLHTYGGAIGVTGTNNYLYYAVTNSTSSGAYMMFDAATVGGSGRKYQIGSTGTGNNPGTGCFELYDATAGSTRMVVNSGGSVGIGMTNPNYTLDVNGTFRCQGSKIVVQNATNGTSARGIYLWTEGDTNWGMYMATGGTAGVSLANATTCAGAGFTSHAIRIRVYLGSDNGFIVENSAETRMFSIRGNDSYANFAGSVQIEGAALLMNGSKNTQRGVEWDYGTGDNRYGLCQDGSGAVRVYIANGYSSGSIKFCRATTYSAFTDLWSIDYNGNLNRTGAGTINTGINMGTGGAGITWGSNYSRIYDDGDLQIYTDDNMHFKNAGGERMTILNNGLIGINNTNPTWLLDLRGNGITTNYLNLATTDGGMGAFAVNQRYCATGSGGGWGSIHYQAAIYTAGTFFGGAYGYGQIAAYRNDDSTIGYFNIATNGTGGFGLSGYGNGTLSITSGRVYNSSDARMKSNINYISETSTPKIMGLKPATFTFKTDPNNTVKMGFIAQDLEQYIPIAVDAKKYQYTWKTKRSEAGEIVPDLDENGNYQYTDEIRPRSVDNMAVLAVLVKAFQEQVQIIEDLKQRIQILESAA